MRDLIFIKSELNALSEWKKSIAKNTISDKETVARCKYTAEGIDMAVLVIEEYIKANNKE